MIQRLDQLRHAFAVDGGCLQHRNFFGHRGADRKRADELLHRLLGARPVGLVDDDHVGNFKEARFHRLDVVAESWRRDDDADIGDFGDVDLVLSRADRFEQHDVEAGAVERVDDAHSGWRQAAEITARRQRAHEHAIVVERRGHANAVAENGAARNRARWIDRDDADGAALLSELRDDGVDERRLARPRRTRETDDESVTEMRLQRPQKRRGRGGQPFEFRDHAGDGAPLALAHAVDRAGHIGVRNARDGHPCFLIRLHHTADKWEAAQVQRLSPGCGLMRGI